MSSSAASYQSAHKLEYLNTQLKADIKKSKDKNALLLKASKQIRVWADLDGNGRGGEWINVPDPQEAAIHSAVLKTDIKCDIKRAYAAVTYHELDLEAAIKVFGFSPPI
jgi:hypothetical protein